MKERKNCMKIKEMPENEREKTKEERKKCLEIKVRKKGIPGKRNNKKERKKKPWK